MSTLVVATSLPRSGLVRAIMENLEALAIAIVMALILKYFLIEAYKIPTGSMQPEIMGDKDIPIFDRVLVNKLVYLVREPRRFEVVVFKNPLWQRQNFIKRLVGFGGERLCIRNGDLFVTPKKSAEKPHPTEAIARKPDEVWRAVRKETTPRRDGKADLAACFRADGGAPAIVGDRIDFPGPADATAAIRTIRPVRDHYLDGYDSTWVEAYHRSNDSAIRHFLQQSEDELSGGSLDEVTDVEIAADVTPAMDAKRIVFEIRESGRTHYASLAVGSGQGLVTTSTMEELAPVEWEDQRADASVPPLRPGVTTRVSFRNVDDELVLELDGRVAMRRPYVTSGLDPDVDPKTHAQLVTHVAVRATGKFALTDVQTWRDIHYLADGRDDGARSAVYTVPDGEYMVLGDNTQNSWDCRQWQSATYDVKGFGAIAGNYFSPRQPWSPGTDYNPSVEGSNLHFRNVYGEEYVFPEVDVLGTPNVDDVHSFKKEFLLGKALAVFWPLPPFSPTFRLKWVR